MSSTSRSLTFPGLATGLVALACAGAVAGADETPRAAGRPPVRLYTNADLERVHPFADETGVSSRPAEAPATAAREPARRGHGEDHWRREAARVRERQRALEERAAGLRARIAEREQAERVAVYGARASRSGSGAGGVASLRASLDAVLRRMRRTQEDLEDRARRDGALPGWLR